MKFKLVFLTIVTMTFIACNPYGKKQMVGDIELYVTDSITADQTAKTVAFLREIGYEKVPISIQVDRVNDVYLLRFVIKKEKLDAPVISNTMPLIKEEASNQIFNGQKVQIDLCDENFKTIKSL